MRRPFHGGNIELARRRPYSPDKEPAILDFSANISPFGPPRGVKETIIKSIDALPNYPDPECLKLRKAIAAHWHVPPDNILVGNGSTELIHLAARMLAPRHALIPIPTFAEYEDAVHLAGGRCLFVTAGQNKNFSWPVERILGRLDQADILFLCTPNSPTGYLMPQAQIHEIIQACKKHKVTLILDETFLDLADGGENRSFVNLAVTSSNLVVLRSFTKLYALPGLRLGYLIAGKTMVRKMGRLQPPWMVNALAQAAGIQALKESSYTAQTVARLNREKKWLMVELSRTPGLFPYPAAANFILCRLTGERIDSITLTEQMAQRGILIRDCRTYRGLGKQFIRIAVRTREENARMLVALREILDGV